MVLIFDPVVSLVLTLHVMASTLIPAGVGEEVRGQDQDQEVRGQGQEVRGCREQEYKERSGSCTACKLCDAGHELSQECGFGYGEDARCVPCRSGRFKEEHGLHKCKPCLDCGLINRLHKENCSSTSNAVCGDCLQGYYRKTKLSGFQDMECIPCGDPPPPYEPHCSGRVNLVPLPPMATSPRDMALAAVICSALATVLLALLVLCAIYCKRQLLQKKPSAVSLRSHDCPFPGAESCLEPRWLQELQLGPCCHCPLGPQCSGPVQLVPSLCCEESCSLGPFHSLGPLHCLGALHSVPQSLEQTEEEDEECGPLQQQEAAEDGTGPQHEG